MPLKSAPAVYSEVLTVVDRTCTVSEKPELIIRLN